jgi:4-amino-4-deoxy-L-arabinose transferase-like glycosyltransferase
VAATPAPAAPRLRLPGALWAILAVALGLRVLVVLATPDHIVFGDPGDYDRIARFLVDQGTYPPSLYADPTSPSALRPPGYPYFLAGLYEVFGKHWDVGRYAGALLGTASVGLLWDVVRRVWDGRLALWTAAIAAILPSLVWIGGGLTAESLFIPLMLGAVWAAVRHRDAGGSGWWVLAAGVLLGLAVITRTNGAIVLLPLLVAAWLPRRRRRDPAVLLVGLVLALTPWTIRNYVAFDALAPLGTQSGFTLVGNYNDESSAPGPLKAAWRIPMTVPDLAPILLQPGTNEVDVDARLRDHAIDYALDHPRYIATSSARHAVHLFQVNTTVDLASGNSFREMGMPRWTWWPATIAFWLLLAAAAAGVVLLARRRRAGGLGPLWLWAVPVVMILGVLPLLGPPRYRIPIDPFLAILAAAALMALRDRVGGRRTPPADPA